MTARTNTQTLVDIDGQLYEAIRVFPPDAAGVERVIVKYVGLYVFAYRPAGVREWKLEDAAAPPAPKEQDDELRKLLDATLDTTTVDVIPPSS